MGVGNGWRQHLSPEVRSVLYKTTAKTDANTFECPDISPVEVPVSKEKGLPNLSNVQEAARDRR